MRACAVLTAAFTALTLLAAPASAEDGVRATVSRDGAAWTIEYRLDREAPVWVLTESPDASAVGGSWRAAQWAIETPGVVLDQAGSHDVLRATSGGPLPGRVVIRFTPAFIDLESVYDPVLTFSNGAVALYSEAFHLVPAASLAAAADLPPDLGLPADAPEWATVTWRDAAGPVLLRGERRFDPQTRQAGAYVVFGPGELGGDASLATVIDPGVPEWIGDELAAYAPQVGDYYARRLGPSADMDGRPLVLISWNGPTPGKTSMAGGALPGQIVMTFEGDGVVETSAGVRNMARWFIGHETAHFWLGQVVAYETPHDSWITEGGADLMALRALKAIDTAYGGQTRLQAAVDECIQFAAQPLSTAAERGQHRAAYACGGVFAMVAEAAQRRATGGDWFDFLAPLIADSREDAVLTRDEWLDRLDAVSDDPSLRRDIEALLDRGSDHPADAVAGLLERAGVAVVRDAGKVRLG